jgi:hypothetical protein
MKVIKNILVGFLVSFVGSIPLGYLNIIGFQIYTDFELKTWFCIIRGRLLKLCDLFYTLIFANRLVNNIKLMRVIDVFGVFFYCFGVFFYSYSNQTAASPNYLEKYMIYFLSWGVIKCYYFKLRFGRMEFVFDQWKLH